MMATPLPQLHYPKLELPAGWTPTILVDTREKRPLPFTFPTASASLPTGDYSIAGLDHEFAVERKTIADLFSSLTHGRDRFMREIQRLRAFTFPRLLVIGTQQNVEDARQHSQGINPKAILNSLHAIEAKGVPVVFTPSPGDASVMVERWAFWFARESLKTSNAILIP
jgi:hypothetical protein